MIQFPTIVSRTLDPSNKSLVGVVGIHDKKLSDADFNLVQSLQDEKRTRLLADQVCSGALTYKPFAFTPAIANTFTVPAFDALVGGEIVTIGGNLSADLTVNRVVLPTPNFWTYGSSAADCSLYVVFLEFWFARLCPDAGSVAGYYQDPVTGVLSFYPYGCVNADLSNLIPNDTIEPFQGIKTTERVQLQWAIRVQSVDPSYNFAADNFGLDPGSTASTTVYGQGNQASPSTGMTYQFTNMASIDGDAGLWRSGDGNTLNELNSMDGYSYAMPLAVVFQRNTGPYDVATNPFGCASPLTPQSGLIQYSLSGRYDSRYADAIYPGDVVDTRSTISLEGWDNDLLVRQGFVDIISGTTRQALARGETPGNKAEALGSLLDYTITVGQSAIANADAVGTFDGYMNGFGASPRSFAVVKAVPVSAKSVGGVGTRWVKGDSFILTLPQSSLATITDVQVQALVDSPVTSTKTPALLLQGQVTITGVGTTSVTVSFPKSLTGTAFDPGLNSLYVQLQVTYPAGTGMDLRRVPVTVYGGLLQDASSGKTLPVFGISEYEVQASQPVTTAQAVWSINSEYSSLIFGTRVWVAVPAASGTATTSGSTTVTTFALTRTGLNGSLTGMYAARAWDQTSGAYYTIAARNISATQTTLTVQGAVAANSVMIVSFLCVDTAQLVYNAPTKAVSSIEETVLVGTATDAAYHMDGRVSVVSVAKTTTANTVVLAADGVVPRAISGDDVNRLIWVRNGGGTYDAVQITATAFQNGVVTLTVPPSVDLTTAAFFVVMAIYPALPAASTMTLTQSYVPYQGEGRLATDYEILTTEDTALVTTNGTGAVPVPGLSDVYPYDRELPIAVTLPALANWTDTTLINGAASSYFDTNFDAKRNGNVEHTFEVPVHTNDFIEPFGGSKRKSVRLLQASGSRGFSKAAPHVGFAIRTLGGRTSLESILTATTSAVVLYVNNLTGSDANDGLSLLQPKKSIQSALSVLPPVLRHPCVIQLVTTGKSYSLTDLSSSLVKIPLGDGDVRQAIYYAIGNLSFSIQASGRLVITAQAGATQPIPFDGSGFTGFGDGPTSAFFVENSRVIFNMLQFTGFRDAAVKGLNANVEFVDCVFTGNLTAGSFEQACTVVLDDCSVTLGDGGTGFILSASELDVSNTALAVSPSTAPGTFFVVERSSAVTLDNHAPGNETNIASTTAIVEAEMNSSVVCGPAFRSGGSASLTLQSVLQQTVAIGPFVGGVTYDASSTVMTSL